MIKVLIRGGAVQAVLSHDRAMLGQSVEIVDCDIDGAELEELSTVKEDGAEFKAHVWLETVGKSGMTTENDRVFILSWDNLRLGEGETIGIFKTLDAALLAAYANIREDAAQGGETVKDFDIITDRTNAENVKVYVMSQDFILYIKQSLIMG